MGGSVKTAIVGIGAWGKNVARELAAVSELVACVNKGASGNEKWLADHLPSTRRSAIEQVLADPTIDAVAIATPIGLLAEFAGAVLEANKHVFVEKPLAKSAAEARDLANVASMRNVIMAAGYLFIYHPIYRELKRRLDGGTVRRVILEWRKFGTFVEPVEQTLLTHHLSLALDLLGEPINGTIRPGAGVESACDRIDTHLFYQDCEAISLIDRASSQRSHTMQVELKNGSFLIWNGAQLLSRQGKRGITEIIYEDRQTPLAVEMMSFVQAVSQERSSLPTAGRFASIVLRILEGLAVIK